MINQESVEAVRTALFNANFIKPLYESYNFVRLPATIGSLLTGQPDPGGLPGRAFAALPAQYDKVILLFIDAFGWRFLQWAYDRYPFLSRCVRDGVVSRLTAQFPSTTSAHVTTIHTGLPVGESGVYEWFYYEPALDDIFAPLLFSAAGAKQRESLQALNADLRTLYPHPTIYERLKAQGVRSFAFQHRDISHSTYSQTMFRGARVFPYRTLAEALTNLSTLVLESKGPAYFFMYYDALDTICHQYGPESPQVAAEIDLLMNALERLLDAPLAGRAKKTLLLITADHGQVEVDPDTTVYLNHTIPALPGWLRANREGKLLVPAGSPRDMFLYVTPDAMDDAQASLERHLEGRAEVYRTADLMAQGFFGPVISEAFRGRLGDLVVLPYARQTVWWYEKDRYEMNFLGHHGGLTPPEMETCLLALPYH